MWSADDDGEDMCAAEIKTRVAPAARLLAKERPFLSAYRCDEDGGRREGGEGESCTCGCGQGRSMLTWWTGQSRGWYVSMAHAAFSFTRMDDSYNETMATAATATHIILAWAARDRNDDQIATGTGVCEMREAYHHEIRNAAFRTGWTLSGSACLRGSWR